ncbi:MAG: PH domain-containing protein [Patescibacteria group bacterium]
MSIESFIHAKDYEKVLHKLRRHPFTFLPTALFFAVLLILPIAIGFLIKTQLSTWLANEAIFTALILLGSIYYIGALIFFFTNFVDFYLDLLVVTNDRLVDMEQNGLFSRTVAEVDLYQIQDVTSEIKGVFATLFNYGDMTIQTAGSVPKFIVHNIKDPHHLRIELMDLAEEDRKYHAK